jgi:tetratricopeptide (TPR) repeat protein
MHARVTAVSAVLLVICLAAATSAKPVDEYVEEAQAYHKTGDIAGAATTMADAVAEHPGSATAYTYLGLYKGMQAGDTDNFMEAGQLSSESFEALDKAVQLDPDHPRARLYRGLMGVKVPEFLGKLPGAIEDLETVIELHAKKPEAVSGEIMTMAYNLLGEGYAKMGDEEKAVAAWEMVIALAPDSGEARQAESAIADLTKEPEPKEAKEEKPSRPIAEIRKDLESAPEDVALMVELGKAYLHAGDFEKAEETLREALAMGPEKPDAHKWLAVTIGESMQGQIYDDRIHEDTDWATKLAFEMVELLDKAVELAPDDMETRLFRGIIDIQMPFFTGKLDQGMEDLEMVIEGDVSDDLKSQAAFWLGYAHQKRATTYWIKVLTDYDDEEAAQLALQAMRPPLRKLDKSKIETPALVIDFTLGFRDELPPQTAVWVETPEGAFVRTLYVSGFSGYAREVQIVLPVWAATSDFAGADAVTGASIDTGQHIYVWDLKDEAGMQVDPGEYVVKVESHFWPSMKYEMASASIKVGGDRAAMATQEGKFIPFLELRYMP